MSWGGRSAPPASEQGPARTPEPTRGQGSIEHEGPGSPPPPASDAMPAVDGGPAAREKRRRGLSAESRHDGLLGDRLLTGGRTEGWSWAMWSSTRRHSAWSSASTRFTLDSSSSVKPMRLPGFWRSR